MANKVESSASDDSSEERATALREALDSLREDFKALRADLGVSGQEALRNLGDEVREKSEVAMDSSRDCIRRNPLLCVGTAFGIGIVIAGLLTRR